MYGKWIVGSSERKFRIHGKLYIIFRSIKISWPTFLLPPPNLANNKGKKVKKKLGWGRFWVSQNIKIRLHQKFRMNKLKRKTSLTWRCHRTFLVMLMLIFHLRWAMIFPRLRVVRVWMYAVEEKGIKRN